MTSRKQAQGRQNLDKKKATRAADLSWSQCRTPYFTLFVLLLLHFLTARAIKVPESEGAYTQEFFEEHRKNQGVYPLLVQAMWDTIRSFSPNDRGSGRGDFSVLDVGCGHGLLVEAWRRAGTTESHCMEGSEEAAPMWPAANRTRYYQVVDLAGEEAPLRVPPTDVVTSFEVAEHLPESRATAFVGLMVQHKPAWVFFGAATVFQDLGKNPSHVNERPLTYWVEKFREHQYVLHPWETLRLRLALLQVGEGATEVLQAWWYPKNALVFVPVSRQAEADRAVLQHAQGIIVEQLPQGDIGGDSLFGLMWKRDWTEFANIFHQARAQAERNQFLEGQGGGEF